MGHPIEKITLKGFKSIKSLENFELRSLNVLIGANGAGKSNFVDFFRMLRSMADEAFQSYVMDSGGGDGFLYLGPKRTKKIFFRLEFGDNYYECELRPTSNSALTIAFEQPGYKDGGQVYSARQESILHSIRNQKSYLYPNAPGVGHYIYNSISSWTVYHFHDTTPFAPVRRDQPLDDWNSLLGDASNIAAYLYHLKDNEPNCYDLICDTIQLVAPYFKDFLFRPRKKGSSELIRLEWQQKGSARPFQPYQFSDGTLRFICLATALLQPDLPATVIIDEPELGLHPFAISTLAALINSAAERSQIVISTQSPALLDHFNANDIITVTRSSEGSLFNRLDPESLESWLDTYTVGELWQKNVVRGGPASE